MEPCVHTIDQFGAQTRRRSHPLGKHVGSGIVPLQRLERPMPKPCKENQILARPVTADASWEAVPVLPPTTSLKRVMSDKVLLDSAETSDSGGGLVWSSSPTAFCARLLVSLSLHSLQCQVRCRSMSCHISMCVERSVGSI